MARNLLMQEVERVFRPGGIELVWLGPTPGAPIRVTIAARPDVTMVFGCRRGRHDHRLGLAQPGGVRGTGRIIVWVEQVARAAEGDWDRRDPPAVAGAILGHALGRALAHELAHLLLGERGHRNRGLLKASLSRSELTQARGPLRLSPEDLARLASLPPRPATELSHVREE